MIKIDTNRYWSVDAACFSDNCVDLRFLMFFNDNQINSDSIEMKMIFYSQANKTPFESESFWTLEMGYCLLFH